MAAVMVAPLPPEPRFSTAWDLNPPEPGDPDFEDYAAQQAAWQDWNDQRIAAIEPPSLTVFDGFETPHVPEAEQRKLAAMIADGLAGDRGWRTLADVPDDPPGELLLGML